jgi:hypothetical protein
MRMGSGRGGAEISRESTRVLAIILPGLPLFKVLMIGMIIREVRK